MNIKKFDEHRIDESASTKFKLGLDVHGVIDSLPEVFSFLTKSIISSKGEVHIITGGRIDDDMINMLKRFDIHYTHLFSILDYHLSIGTPTDGNHPKYGFPMISDEIWDKTKGDYCKKHNISLHIDDTLIYNENFTTPFARLWTHTNTPKPIHKDPRHLD